jgi:hypothetical protein
VLVEQISINESGQDEDENRYDPRSDPFTTSGELTCRSPLRIKNEVTYSAYYFTTTFEEIVTPLTPPVLTAGTLSDAVIIRFVGTVTLFYYAEVAMQYVSGAITYDLDFYAGYSLSQ